MSAHRRRLPKVLIWTDGSYCEKTQTSGWSAILLFPDFGYAQELHGASKGNNNRMELLAAIKGLQSISNRKFRVTLVTDSRYVKDGVRKIKNWRSRKWLKEDGSAISDQDLWKELSQIIQYHKIIWKWTKGHRDDILNIRADLLAGWESGRRSRQSSRSLYSIEEEGGGRPYG